jgi:hypothetical protein
MQGKKFSIDTKKIFFVKEADISFFAFIILFFSETTYYLLVLQTGIVEYFHSNLSQIWTIPLGGIIGISLIATLKNRYNIVLLSLIAQTLLMFLYPRYNIVTLFVLGLLSGLVAPYLIYHIKNLYQIAFALGLSYVSGTFGILMPAGERGYMAVILSITALISFLFIDEIRYKRKTKTVSYNTLLKIFIWLTLDATLFEMLSRSSVGIWRSEDFVYIIALSHIVGLVLALIFHKKRYSDIFIMSLFLLSYSFFMLGMQYPLSIVYPIVISYYNVIVLKNFMQLPFNRLVLASFGLWVSAGIGLFVSLILL